MNVNAFFLSHPRVAVAFSGGVDSAYLLYAAKKAGAQVLALYAQSAFQPAFEWEDAQRLAEKLEIPLKKIQVDVLAEERIMENSSERCYFCKRRLFEALWKAAAEEGFSVLVDGTNASDLPELRPGMKALQELGVLSPLQECGLTKEMIRELSQKAELFTWNKPAYACLATRIAQGERITETKLQLAEASERFLFSLGFRNFRVRQDGGSARIEVCAAQFETVLENRQTIVGRLEKDYDKICLDLKERI